MRAARHIALVREARIDGFIVVVGIRYILGASVDILM